MFPFPKLYLYAGLAAAIVATFLYIRFLHARVDHWKAQYDQVQATLNVERAEHKAAMEENERKRVADLADATKLRDDTVAHLSERLQFNTANAAALAERLRVAERSRVRPLAPAASSPAECRDYAADPTRMDDAARGFFIGEASAAEATADLLEACRADYRTVKVACGIKD